MQQLQTQTTDKLRSDIKLLALSIEWNAVEIGRAAAMGVEYTDVVDELTKIRANLQNELHQLRRELGIRDGR